MNERHGTHHLVRALASTLATLGLGGFASFSSSHGQVNDGESWPGFRGANADGTAEGFATAVQWSVPEKKGIAWSTPVPGLAHSSPVVFGERVFVTTAVRKVGAGELGSLYGSDGYGAGDPVDDEGEHAFQLLCLDATSGEILWTRTAHEGVPKVKRHPKSTHANSTPACDAERVVAFFASEGLHAYDHAGEHLWSRDFGVLEAGAPNVDREAARRYPWGFASSPVLHDGKVLLQCDVQDGSFVTALDAKTGKEVWRTERDERPTWSTPTVALESCRERPQVILNGYAHIGGYDLATGEELWKLAGGGDVPVPTPVVAHGLVFLTSAHGRQSPLYALDLKAKGELSFESDDEAPFAWHHPGRGIYMQTPLVYGYELYACSDGGIVTCYDAGTGERLYRERLGDGRTGFSASAVAADGKVYFTAESGEVFVVRAGPEFELLATNELGETCLSTPAITEQRLLFRTRGHLVAVAAPD